jgi:hypothetical protein
MTGLVRKATLLAALGLVVATSAMAGIPYAANCTAPSFIKVVGFAGALPDARGTFTVNIRDNANAPIANCLVQVDFTAVPDMRLCNTGGTVSCGTAVVAGLTNVSGDVVFTITGACGNTGGLPGAGANGVSIYAAGGVLIRTATAIVFDQNGLLSGGNGVGASDFVPLLKDWGTGIYFGRSDCDASGVVPAADFLPLLQCWGDGTSSSGCTFTYCP